MSVQDLTRWNRAGLGRLRYIDGNAVIYYDLLRQRLYSQFEGWLPAPPANESDAQREQRLVAAFTAPRGDWGVELVRELARATHVLAEYIDAYANEATLRTATQWDNVRRLVEMLNYHPAPPASASTPLILEAKPQKRGRVAKGFSVKNAPIDGSAPVIFETLADLDVDAALNALRLTGHDRSPVPLVTAVTDTLVLAEKVTGLKLGEPIVLENERTGFTLARLITGIREQDGLTALELNRSIDAGAGFTYGETLIHVKPADKLVPLGPLQTDADAQMLGDSLVLTAPPRALSTGDVVYIADDRKGYYRRVFSIEGARLNLDTPLDGSLHLDSAYVSRARAISVTRVDGRSIGTANTALFSFKVAGDLTSFGPPAVLADIVVRNSQPVLRSFEVVTAKYLPPNVNDPLSGYTTFTVFDPDQHLENPQAIYFPSASREWRLDTFLYGVPGARLPLTITTELPKAASSGDFAVVSSGNQLGWARLANVAVDNTAGRAQLSVTHWHKRATGRFYVSQTWIYAHLRQKTRLRGWNENPTSVSGASLSLAVAARPELLITGRRLWIEQLTAQGAVAGREVLVTDLTESAVLLDQPLAEDDGFTVGNTVIRGNVVTAGHGEAQNERILGSGVASALNQSFVLDVPAMSFVADPTFPAGVRADIDVLVDGLRWQQVGALDDFGTADQVYSPRMTEPGFVRIDFGDGVHGRRLPSGSNNVRVRYRLGSGLAGNVPAGQLETPQRPHPLVDKIRQPLSASGGGDMESRDALKRNAPASVLTLERAVSTVDYAHLASAHAAVWSAAAFGRPSARQRRRIEVVVVPAGGVMLDGRLQSALTDFLHSHSQPGVDVSVREFDRVWLHLDITVRVASTEADPQVVKAQVRTQLQQAFALERRTIGAPLYLSDVFAIVETIPGVRNSSCRLLFERAGQPVSAADQQIPASPREVIYLDLAARPGALRLQVEEFAL